MTQWVEAPAEEIEHIRKQGLGLRERGEHGRALALFDTLGARWPRDGRNPIDRAVCLNAMGRLVEAIAVLTQALEGACATGGWHKPCLLHLARFHQQAGDAPEAARYIRLCLAKWPNDVAVLLDAATQAAQAGRPDAAR